MASFHRFTNVVRISVFIVGINTSTSAFSQDIVLSTSVNKLSLSSINACKGKECITTSIRIINDALEYEKMQINDAWEERVNIIENVIQYNKDVALLKKYVDSLSDVADNVKQQQKEYALDREPVVGKRPVGPNYTTVSALDMTQSADINKRVQAIEENQLKRKKNALSMSERSLAGGQAYAEKQKAKLVKDGDYLSIQLKRNAARLQSEQVALKDLLNFTVKVNKLFSAEPFTIQKIAPVELSEYKLIEATISNDKLPVMPYHADSINIPYIKS